MIRKLGALVTMSEHVRALSAHFAMLTVAALAGCATPSNAYLEGTRLAAQGHYPEALAKLKTAVDEHPGNLEMRAALNNTKQAAVEHELHAGDRSRLAQDPGQAERHYRAVLDIDPGNAVATADIATLKNQSKESGSLAEASKLLADGDIDGADEIVRGVLAENPDNPQAQKIVADIAASRAAKPSAGKRLAAAFRKPISLEFHDASLQSVFGMVSKVSGVNFFFDKDVKTDTKVNVSASRTTVEDAVHLILVTNQLCEKILNDNSVLVYPNTPQKQKDYQTLVVRNFFLANAEAKQVAATLKAILKLKDMDVNEKLNLIVVRDTPEAVRLAEKLIAVEDVGEPEVMLEVEVMEVQRSRLLDLGIQWPNQISLQAAQNQSQTGNTGTTGTSSSSTSTSSLTLQQLTHLNSGGITATISPMTFNANQQDTDADVLANPRIRVKNKEKAKIMIGDRVPVVTTTSTATGFVSDSVNYVDVGLKLEVQPTIYLDHEIGIDLSLEVSSIDSQITEQSGTVVYQIGTRNASTVLQLRDGETQILGGLIQDQDSRAANKVPGLGNFPVLGKLFSNQNNNSQKTEIVLAITPHLVRTLHRPAFSAAEFESGTETDLGGRGLAISNVDSATPTPTQPTTPNKNAASRPAAASGVGVGKSIGSSSGGFGSAASTGAAGSALSGGTAGTDASATDGVAQDDASNGQMLLGWTGPRQVTVGQQFSLTLQAQSTQPISSMPISIGFNPAQFQVMNLTAGDFFSQAGGQAASSSKVGNGQINLQLQSPSGPVSGTGSLLTLVLKAIAPASQAQIIVESAAPQPAVATSALPVQSITIVGGQSK